MQCSARDNINALSSTVIVAIGMGPGTSAEVGTLEQSGKCHEHIQMLAATCC
jgi:hypothetical protein